LFIDIVINGDYEASWSSSGLILDFQEPYEWEDTLLDELIIKLKVAMNDNKNGNKEFIEAVLKMFEEE
jgi:hypothetical protein